MTIAFSRNEDCKPATEGKIAAFEAQHGVLLPADFRGFLCTSTGGYPARDWSSFNDTGDFVAHIYGLHEGQEWKQLDYAVREFGHDLSQFLPVAISNGGNYFLLRVTEPDRGAVYFWDHELEDPTPPTFEEIIRISSSFSEWIDSLEKPRDENG